MEDPVKKNSNVKLLAAACAGLVSILCFRVLFFSPTVHPMKVGDLNTFLFAWTSAIDTSGQRRGHLLALGATALLVLGASLLHKIATSNLFMRTSVWVARALALIMVLFFLSSYFWWWQETMSLLIGVIATALIYLYARHLESARAKPEYLFATVALLVVLLVPGFFAPLDLSADSPEDLMRVQAHYTLVVSHGERLGAGHVLTQDVKPLYGLVMPLITGAWQKYFGIIDFGTDVQIIRIMQIVFLLMAAFLFQHWSKGSRFAPFIALAFIAPWYHFNQLGFHFPNNTPWRALGLPLGLLVLTMVHKENLARLSFLLGLTGGFLMLLNFETGAPVAVGLLAYLYFRHDLFGSGFLKRLPLTVALFGLGVIAADLSFCLVYKMVFGMFPGWDHLYTLAGCATFIGSTGLSGWKGSFNPAAALIFTHAAFVLLYTAFSAQGTISHKQSYRACVASTILVWFAYYANRPHPWNLVTFYFLYGFFLIDILREFCHIARKRKAVLGPQLAIAAALGLIVFPQLASAYQTTLPHYLNGWHVMRHGAIKKPAKLVSGVYLSADVADELFQKTEFLKGKSHGEPVIYFTANSFILPKLTGIYPPLPVGDTFTEVYTKKAYKELISRVLQLKPKSVYFDDPATITSGDKAWHDYYNQVRKDLSSAYQKAATKQGWEIWDRIPSDT
ncbi:MAG: hypothetical protein HY711_06595 [Candidatus Melainabacteria bacterium]|nr:hypothetical protein [Candidatus Melainabacteria bacterium]